MAYQHVKLETVARALVGYVDWSTRNQNSLDQEIVHSYVNMLRDALPAAEPTVAQED